MKPLNWDKLSEERKEEIREINRMAAKRYRENNREKVREANRRYREANREKCKERCENHYYKDKIRKPKKDKIFRPGMKTPEEMAKMIDSMMGK